jgi:transcriptional regulator with XRE-family HTH domain
LSQRALAEKAGVTFSTISLIERDQVSPSVGSLRKILNSMSVSLAEFFAGETPREALYFYKKSVLTDLGSGGISLKLIGEAYRDRNMSILQEVYPKAADTGEDMLQHDGEEGGVVISGEIEITVNGVIEVLTKGDAYYFDSTLPHRFRNVGKDEAEVISASTPPSF